MRDDDFQPEQPILSHEDLLLSPKFKVEKTLLENEPCANVYMELFERKKDATFYPLPEEQWHLLAQVSKSKLTIHPIHANPYARRYRDPQLGNLTRLIFVPQYHFSLPDNEDDFSFLLDSHLGKSFYTEPEKGLGLHRDLFPVWLNLARLPGVTTLVVDDKNRDCGVLRDGEEIRISRWLLDKMLSTSRSIYRKYTSEIRSERLRMGRNMLLAELDNVQFPVELREEKPKTLKDYLASTKRQPQRLTKEERVATVDLVQTELSSLVKEAPRQLVELHADIERITLAAMIERFGDLMRKPHREQIWQTFFEQHHFILALLFARPVHLLHNQPQTRSPMVSGRGAQYSDFLLGEGIGGIALVEIKCPEAKIAGRIYRKPDIYSMDEELTGAVTQLLHQRMNFIEGKIFNGHRDEELRDRHTAAVKCVLIAGKTPADKDKMVSFDLYRNSAKDVEIITFDEILNKLVVLQQHLNGAGQSGNAFNDEVPF